MQGAEHEVLQGKGIVVLILEGGPPHTVSGAAQVSGPAREQRRLARTDEPGDDDDRAMAAGGGT